MNIENLRAIVRGFIAELQNRSGLDNAWPDIDGDIQNEIIESLIEMVSDRHKLGLDVRSFYNFADSRNTVPAEYKKAIEWFVLSIEEFDEDLNLLKTKE